MLPEIQEVDDAVKALCSGGHVDVVRMLELASIFELDYPCEEYAEYAAQVAWIVCVREIQFI